MLTGPMASSVAVYLVFGGKFLAHDWNDIGFRHQRGALDSQFVEAGFRHVLRVGLQAGGSRRQFAFAITSLIEQETVLAEEIFDFSHARAQLLGFKLQQAFAGLGGVALGIEIGGLLLELLIFTFALKSLRGGALDLRGQSVDALIHFGEEQFDAIENRGCRSMSLFERGHAGGVLRGSAGRFLAALAAGGEGFLRFGNLTLELDTLIFESGDFGFAR